MKPKKPEERAVYPHAEFIAKLYEAMGERKITEAEARACLNARVFESILEVWLPELRDILQGMKDGEPDFENTQMMIAQAAGMAHALGIELSIAKSDAQKVKRATDKEIERILHSVKNP